jgi:hypothetical protein
MSSEMLLTAYTIDLTPEAPQFEIRPASAERSWIDQTTSRFAARCLPLLIANAHGWEILFKDRCEIIWNGGNGQDDIKVVTETKSDRYVSSHFGEGILTFRIHALFRTDPGINLWVGGPINQFKDGIQALTGIVETDWSPFTFTMNWRITRPDHPIVFERDEPICHVFPLQRGTIDEVVPLSLSIDSDPELKRDYEDAKNARDAFIKGLKENDPEYVKQGWQRNYFRGAFPSGRSAFAGHKTKVNPKPFQEKP